MSDIFREVEEDVRRERLEKFWKAYGDYIIALGAVIVIALAGYELWQRYDAAQRDKASTQFTAAQHISNPAQAAAAFAALSKTAPSGYTQLSQMQQANALLAANKQADAVALYKQIAAADSGALGAAARLRAGWALADSASHADLETLLQPLLNPGSVWKQMAEEILAFSDYRTGNTLAAATEFGQLAGDPNSPDSLRNRARAFAAFLGNGGARNYGTVPPSLPAPAPGAPPAAP